MTGHEAYSFIGRGSIIWDRGDNFRELSWEVTGAHLTGALGQDVFQQYKPLSLWNMHLKSLLLNKLFSNFKMEKHRRILVCCFRFWVEIYEKITDIVSLFPTYPLLLRHSCWHYRGLFYSELLHLLIKNMQFAEQKLDCKSVYSIRNKF